MAHILAFERPVVELITRVRELRELANEDDRFGSELKRLEDKAAKLAREVFAKLSPMQKVQLSRHPNRPYTNDYIERLFTDFVELHGDRRFAEDGALIAGIGKYHGRSVVVVGHQKGRTSKEQTKRNFGMPNPEGYRKAIACMSSPSASTSPSSPSWTRWAPTQDSAPKSAVRVKRLAPRSRPCRG